MQRRPRTNFRTSKISSTSFRTFGWHFILPFSTSVYLVSPPFASGVDKTSDWGWNPILSDRDSEGKISSLLCFSCWRDFCWGTWGISLRPFPPSTDSMSDYGLERNRTSVNSQNFLPILSHSRFPLYIIFRRWIATVLPSPFSWLRQCSLPTLCSCLPLTTHL